MNLQDFVFIGLSIAFFLLCAAYARSCEMVR